MYERLSMVKVSKFGGSSLADASQIKKVCDIILSDPDRKLVVVSAPGKRYRSDIKVTDLLIALAEAYISGYDPDYDYKTVMARYIEIANQLDIGYDIINIIRVTVRINNCYNRNIESFCLSYGNRFIFWINDKQCARHCFHAADSANGELKFLSFLEHLSLFFFGIIFYGTVIFD